NRSALTQSWFRVSGRNTGYSGECIIRPPAAKILTFPLIKSWGRPLGIIMGNSDRSVRSIQIVSSIDEEASGPSYTVVRLSQELLACGDPVRLVTLGGSRTSPDIPFLETYPMRPVLILLGFSPQMRDRLAWAAEHSDILHNHGLWMMPNVYPGWVVRARSCRLVVSPRGMLSRWALNRSAWKKRVFWTLVQGPAVRRASCFHATAEREYEDIRSAG